MYLTPAVSDFGLKTFKIVGFHHFINQAQYPMDSYLRVEHLNRYHLILMQLVANWPIQNDAINLKND